MKNRDLIAFLKPAPNQFSRPDAVEFIDITGRVTEVVADRVTLKMVLDLKAGLYSGRFETTSKAFDMATAMIEMVRVPDGKRVPVGPWDLDHINNVMAVPMIRTYVNGKLKGGLWFAMPGPEQIADGRLAAEFGFEAIDGKNELLLEFIERDRERMDWGRIEYIELRKDDRNSKPIVPATQTSPRIFISAVEVDTVRKRWQGSAGFEKLCARLLSEELVFLTDNSQGTLSLACLVYAITGDSAIGARAKEKINEIAQAATWSGRPDPLLMGGDNDRGISLRLFHMALAWDYLKPLLSEDERKAILSKSEEYLQKMYDFTLLQRAYMGCPAIDPHSLGSWNGAAIACMAFYEELAIARHALPFFHGLFCSSLKLFPASGKAAWATYFPFHLVLYLAAAHTFAGKQPELDASAFLDNLGQALLASFEVPNSQEMQRGLRTREHRFLTAFLCRFHKTPDIESIYRAFAAKEMNATGDVILGIFDLLYSPPADGEVASIQQRPLFAKDTGDLIAMSHGVHTIAVAMSAGPKAGREAIFSLMPHNREFAPSMAALDLSMDGTPVLCNINMSVYGIDSALTNTMCFENGGAVTNGQYLNGAIAPECGAVIRRCLIGERYVYAHAVITHALDPKLKVHRADRILFFDRKSGIILLSDTFAGERAIRFATHLHCSGSVTELPGGLFRLTGGQANLIAGIKGGSKGLDDGEKGEIFVQLLKSAPASRVVVEEPTWVPGYIYGLNNTGREEISEARYPRYRRWRLEAAEQSMSGSFLIALNPQQLRLPYEEGKIELPDQGGVQFGFGALKALDVRCICECLIEDKATASVTAMGVTSLEAGAARLCFANAVDLEYNTRTGEGKIYAQGDVRSDECSGFKLGPWNQLQDEGWRTSNTMCRSFQAVAKKG